jgi:arylsulfatase
MKENLIGYLYVISITVLFIICLITSFKKKDVVIKTGKVTVVVESKLVDKIGGPMDITLKVNGEIVAQGNVPTAMSLHFTGGNETFDIGCDMGSPVSLAYFDKAPFAFNGKIGKTKIMYTKYMKVAYLVCCKG